MKIDEDLIERSKHIQSKVFAQFQPDKILQLRYSTERSITLFVHEVLLDMIELSQLNRELYLDAGQKISHVAADYLVVSCYGIPIGAIEVNKPGTITASKKAKVYGQLLDYILMVQSFYGATYVLGILTNYKSWQICWLPHSDRCALAEDLDYDDDITDQMSAISAREIHASRNYEYTDARTLTIVLCSALKKMKKNLSFYRPQSFLSSKRNYIELSRETWVWNSTLTTNVKLLSFSFPSEPSSNLYLLIDFVQGVNGKVWLVCENKLQSGMSVLKFMLDRQDDANAEKEVKAWQALGFPNVYSARYNDTPAIVMPVAFTYKDYGKGLRCIDYSKWMVSTVNPFDTDPQVDAIPEENDPRLQVHFDMIPAFRSVYQQLKSKDPKEVLKDCIKKCIKNKLVHEDVEWRHVGLFPTLLENGEYELISSFIDLGDMISVESEEAAAVVMKESFLRLTEKSWD